MRKGTCDRAAACGSPLYAWRRTSGSPLPLTRSRAWVELGCPSPTFSPCRLWFCSFSRSGSGAVWVYCARGYAGARPDRATARTSWSGASLASFTLALGLARALPRPLPTGSHLERFDRAVWHDPRSADYVPGDVTPRQKMLADVVKSVLPGRTRVELEEILGASLETPYFKSSGRDLIYVLGPQRDSYFTIDSEWLLIWLDKDGRFERYTIAND